MSELRKKVLQYSIWDQNHEIKFYNKEPWRPHSFLCLLSDVIFHAAAPIFFLSKKVCWIRMSSMKRFSTKEEENMNNMSKNNVEACPIILYFLVKKASV
jgi:hypothetical protein